MLPSNARELDRWPVPMHDLERWDRQPEIEAEYVVESDSDPDTAYHVQRINALSVPFDEADVVADQVDIWTCSCPDFVHRRWPDEEPESLGSLSKCKHCDAFKSGRAADDESQTALGEAVR